MRALPFLLIAAIVTAAAWVSQRIELLYGGPTIAGGALAAVPVLVAAGLPLLRRWLSSQERAVVYAGLAIGVPVAASGMVHRLIPSLVTGLYGGFARPGSRYQPFLDKIPGWSIPGAPNGPAAVGAFEGGERVPWDVWIVPLAAWGAFLAGVFVLLWGIALLMRKRWIEDEYLTFPLLALPQSLLDSEAGDGLLANRPFWIGAAVSLGILSLKGVHHYSPSWPDISMSVDIGAFLVSAPWSSMSPFTAPFVFSWSPLDIGIAFFMPLDVSLGTWVFYLASRAQLLVVDLLGLSGLHGTFPGLGGEWMDWPNVYPFFMSQTRGGIFLLALACLWRIRRGGSVGQAWKYLGTGSAILLAWMSAYGISPLSALWVLVVFVLVAIGFGRLRLEGGVPVAGGPVLAGYMMYLLVGTGAGAFGVQTHIGFAFLGILATSSAGIWLAMQLEGMKLAGGTRDRARMIGAGMAIGLGVGLAVGVFFTLSIVYEKGLFFLSEQGAGASAARMGRYTHYLYEQAGTRASGTDWERLLFHAFGACVTGALLFLRRTHLRWPLHPAGYVFGTGFGRSIWGSVLVAWAVKAFVVRYWGVRGVKHSQSVFLGLVFGALLARILWAFVSLAAAEPGEGFMM